MKTCPDCNGEGVLEKGTDDEQQCPTCGGSGFVPNDDDHENTHCRCASQLTAFRQMSAAAQTGWREEFFAVRGFRREAAVSRRARRLVPVFYDFPKEKHQREQTG